MLPGGYEVSHRCFHPALCCEWNIKPVLWLPQMAFNNDSQDVVCVVDILVKSFHILIIHFIILFPVLALIFVKLDEIDKFIK